MTLVSDFHVWCKMKYRLAPEESDLNENTQQDDDGPDNFWTLFNTDGSIVYQKNEEVKECIMKMEKEDYVVACNDFSNVDRTDSRIVVMTQCNDFYREMD